MFNATILKTLKTVPISVASFSMHDHSDFNIHIEEELFRLGEASVLVRNANVNRDVYGEYKNEPAEDNITIMSLSNEKATRSTNHPSRDTSLGPLDHSSSTTNLSVSVSPYPFNGITGMVDFSDAVSYQPFQHPDCEYCVHLTEPISWCSTKCSVRFADPTRSGSPTNVAKESVFLMNSENETDVDDENEDLSPTVSPCAYAHPDVYGSPRASQNLEFDSSDEDMSFNYESSGPDSDEYTLGSEYTDVGDEVALLRVPGDTAAVPIDLTNPMDEIIYLTDSRDDDMKSATQVDDGASDKLFSDTSDESINERSSQRPPVARILDFPNDEVNDIDESEEWEWDITEEQAFLSLGLPDACILTGRALAFGQMPLVQDAAQRSFYHLYLEEAIARGQRRIMTEDHDHLGSINPFDPVNINVMTSLHPEYVSNVEDIIHGGVDEDFHGVFTYVSADDDDDNHPHDAVIRNLPPPNHEHGLMVSMVDLRANPNYWVCDTGASGPSCVHVKGLIKVRDRVSDEMHGNNGSTLPIVKRFDMAGTVHNRQNEPVSSIVIRGVNHVPSSTFNLFSVAQSLKHGWKFYGNYQGFVLTKGDARIVFDIRIPSGTGYLWATTIVPSKTAGINPEVTNFSGSTEKVT